MPIGRITPVRVTSWPSIEDSSLQWNWTHIESSENFSVLAEYMDSQGTTLVPVEDGLCRRQLRRSVQRTRLIPWSQKSRTLDTCRALDGDVATWERNQPALV